MKSSWNWEQKWPIFAIFKANLSQYVKCVKLGAENAVFCSQFFMDLILAQMGAIYFQNKQKLLPILYGFYIGILRQLDRMSWDVTPIQ